MVKIPSSPPPPSELLTDSICRQNNSADAGIRAKIKPLVSRSAG